MRSVGTFRRIRLPMAQTRGVKARTLRNRLQDRSQYLLANFADGSLSGSHDRSLRLPLQDLLIEDLDRDGRKPRDPTFHIISVVVRAVMLS